MAACQKLLRQWKGDALAAGDNKQAKWYRALLKASLQETRDGLAAD